MFLCLNKLPFCRVCGHNKIVSLRKRISHTPRPVLCTYSAMPGIFYRIVIKFFIGHLYNKKKVAPIKMRPLYLRGSTTYVENFTF